MGQSQLSEKIIAYLSNYHPDRIGIFGSYVRGEQTSGSDIDILVRFKETVSLLQLVKMERELSKLLGIKVDLVSEDALKHPVVKRNIERELQIIYE